MRLTAEDSFTFPRQIKSLSLWMRLHDNCADGVADDGAGVAGVAGARRFPCLTHSLCGQHVVDGVVVLLSQDGQLTCLFLFEAFEDGLVVGFGSALQQVVPQGLVLAGLDLTGLLELTLDLQLFGLKTGFNTV